MDGGWRHLPSLPDSVCVVTAPLVVIVLVFGGLGLAFMTRFPETSPCAAAPDDGDSLPSRPALQSIVLLFFFRVFVN